MNTERHTLPPETLVPKIMALLEVCDAVPLVITGGSMTPFLAHQRDTVYLSKPRRQLKRGDMIFYRRDDGRYVLHRICRIKDGTYWLIGDAQTGIEPGIRPDQVIALVIAVRRNGRLIKPGNISWEFFEHCWIRMIPLRPVFFKIHSIFH
jgi:hypothetical protein